MLVCIPYCERDHSRATALLRWIAELGNVSGHDVVLFPDEGVDYSEDLRIAQSCFKTAAVNPIDKPISTAWPISANHAWKRVVDWVDYFKRYPMLYLETDAIPLVPDWLNRIESEYLKDGKPFMGYLEYSSDPERRHMNGVAVYRDIHQLAPSALSAPTDHDGANFMAFDWAGKDEVVPQMHVSPLFQFQYKKEAGLLRDETLSWLKPEAVIFHTCKDVRIFDLLRARLGWKAAPVAPVNTQAVPDKTGATAAFAPASRGLTCDIFIKTYDKVTDWHDFALRSIARHCTGFRRTVVIGHQPVESYQAMQVHKLNADLYTDADYILTTDSDTIFACPVTPETYMRDGKTIWLHRTWKDALAQEGDAVMRWHRGMTKFFGAEPPFEFMCRHPELIPRWLYSAFRIFCFERHGKTMAEWVETDKEFADWNMLGYYAWLYHREAFYWINQSEVAPPPLTVKQYWGGHTPIEPHIAEMEAIIAGGVEIVHTPNNSISNNQPGGAGASPAEFAGSRSAKEHPESPGAEEQKPALSKSTRRKKKVKRVLTPEHKAALRAALERARAAKAQKALAA